MVKNGVEALSTTIPTYAKTKALTVIIQIFVAFTQANLYFPKASQELGYCNTTKISLIASKIFKNEYYLQILLFRS